MRQTAVQQRTFSGRASPRAEGSLLDFGPGEQSGVQLTPLPFALTVLESHPEHAGVPGLLEATSRQTPAGDVGEREHIALDDGTRGPPFKLPAGVGVGEPAVGKRFEAL